MNSRRVLLASHDKTVLESLSGALSKEDPFPLDVRTGSSTSDDLSDVATRYDALVLSAERGEDLEVVARLKKSDGQFASSSLPAVICPQCHLSDRRVERKSSFLRYEDHATTVPCDLYPDGTGVSEVERKADVAVFKFECPVCGLTVESQNRTELPTATESP